LERKPAQPLFLACAHYLYLSLARARLSAAPGAAVNKRLRRACGASPALYVAIGEHHWVFVRKLALVGIIFFIVRIYV
jgi:hypothetical protein